MTKTTLSVAVGSKNASKIRATKDALTKVFPNHEIKVTGISVESGIAAQPLSDSETMNGAINRATNLKLLNEPFDYYIGIEGGINLLNGMYFECGFVAVLNNDNVLGVGTSGRFELSSKIIKLLNIDDGKAEMELGYVMNLLSGLDNVRENAGAMGLLTNGLLDRDVAYQTGIIFAFSKFVSSKIYW